MLSLFRQTSRQKGLKQRRSRRNRRVAKIVAPAVITTALLIPIISTLSGDPATSDGTSTCSTSSGSTDSGTATTSGSGGGTSGGGSGTDSTSGTSSTCATGTSSGSSGSGTTATGGTGGTTSGSGGTAGDLSGLVLAFDEVSSSDTESDTTTTTPGTDETGTGSSFDEYPAADLITIEEDWELIVTQPDPLLGAPQVGTVMTPFEDSGDFYLAFVLNHRFNPTYSAGGMELQLWYQGQQLGWLSFGEGLLSTLNEQIKWTQRLELKQEKLRFSVVKGHSATWGDFGSGDSMHLELATTLADLNDYHPNVSAENSGVVFASNRVGTLSLKKVRGYDKNGVLVLEDTDPVVVFALGQ